MASRVWKIYIETPAQKAQGIAWNRKWEYSKSQRFLSTGEKISTEYNRLMSSQLLQLPGEKTTQDQENQHSSVDEEGVHKHPSPAKGL